MTTTTIQVQYRMRWAGCAALATLFCMPLGASASPLHGPCETSAQAARQACRKNAVGEYWLQLAKCANLATFQERLACGFDAISVLHDANEECTDIHHARLDVCDQLGPAAYHPSIDSSHFVPFVTNPYMPLVPGTTYVYEKQDGEEVERTEVTVTEDTKEILGVLCTVVRDVVSLDGVPIEDTLDWFAQDIWGNVWYFGEIALNYEDGQIVDIEGSWEAGVDGAQPGIVMKASPQVGQFYRQEFLIGEAEDVAGIVSLSETVVVPYTTFSNCMQTMDFTPLEPDVLEYKFFAPGVGLVLEVDPESGERKELVMIQRP